MTNINLLGSRPRRDTIKCECGAEIALLHDAKIMGEAIEVHASIHIQNATDLESALAESDRIQDALIAQVFIKATES